MGFIALLSLALAPGTAIALYIYLKDQHEREPLHLLLLCFLYGSLSTLVTLLITLPVNFLILTRDDDVIHQFFNAFFKVALVEEFSKFLFVRLILYKSKHFNEPFDGIVYAVMVSMGFATIENIIYVYQFGPWTGILRMFTAVPAHAVFGIMMGYYLGKAKFTHRQQGMLTFLALFTPTLFHGAYDYFLFIAEIKGVYAGIWLGSATALIIGIALSRKAIHLHQQSSPFRGDNPLL
jgi:protease PrsW